MFQDRCFQTSTTTGLGSFTLSPTPPGGYRTLLDAFGQDEACYYVIAHETSGQWEVGEGLITLVAGSHVLDRVTVLSSSSGGLPVSFDVGAKVVKNTLPSTLATKLLTCVLGSGSSADNAIPRWSGTAGDRLKNSTWTINDSGKLKGYSSYSPVTEPTVTAGELVFDLNTNNVFYSGDITEDVQLTVLNVTVNQRFAIRTKMDSVGGWLVLFFDTIRWPNGSPPVPTATASSWDWYGFVCVGLDSYAQPLFDGFVLGQAYTD